MPALHVRRLSLTNVRNYQSLDVELPVGVSAFVGANGQGKTNLVEAVGYLSTLGSHRVATDAPLVRRGCDSATVRAEVVRADRSLQIEVEIVPGRTNRARINRSPVPRPREILGIVRTVVFAPEDLALVKGDPAERRRFLDDLMVQRQPRLAGTRADFDRVLRQRNALLKSSGSARRAHPDQVAATLEVWDEHLATLGSEIVVARARLVDDLGPLMSDAYAAVAPGGQYAQMAYSCGVPSSIPGVDCDTRDRDAMSAAIMAALAARRREELDRGITLVGPHRDDVTLSLGGFPAKGYASHGESWSVALAMRLASFDLLSSEGDVPVLILDDVFAELDAIRRAHLAQRVCDGPQVLVTAAVGVDVPIEMTGAWFDVVEGTVTPRDRQPQ